MEESEKNDGGGESWERRGLTDDDPEVLGRRPTDPDEARVHDRLQRRIDRYQRRRERVLEPPSRGLSLER